MEFPKHAGVSVGGRDTQHGVDRGARIIDYTAVYGYRRFARTPCASHFPPPRARLLSHPARNGQHRTPRNPPHTRNPGNETRSPRHERPAAPMLPRTPSPRRLPCPRMALKRQGRGPEHRGSPRQSRVGGRSRGRATLANVSAKAVRASTKHSLRHFALRWRSGSRLKCCFLDGYAEAHGHAPPRSERNVRPIQGGATCCK
jgi:hypothetical protein